MDVVDDFEALWQTIERFPERLRRLEVPSSSVEDAMLDLWLATTAILIRAAALAEGMAKLLFARRVVPALGPVFRALLELSVDFDHLLDAGEPTRNGTKFLISGVLEQQAAFDEIRKTGAEIPELAELEGAIAGYKERSPGPFAEVVEQRRKGRYHWSGETQTKLMAAATRQPLVYRVLSWASHPIGAARSFKIVKTEEGGTLQFDADVSAFFSAEQLARVTRAALEKMWKRYARLWKLADVADGNVPA